MNRKQRIPDETLARFRREQRIKFLMLELDSRLWRWLDKWWLLALILAMAILSAALGGPHV